MKSGHKARGAALALVLPVALAVHVQARAQAWPAKPVRVLVGFSAGGPTDVVARAFADYASRTLGSVLPQVHSGKLTALAVAAPKRSALLPGVPTFEESGVKGYTADAWYGLLFPAKTPPDVLATLRRVATEFSQAPATQEKLRSLGMEARNTCGDAFGAQLAGEVKLYGDLARALDLKTE